MRDASERSDDNLQKMLAGIERLVDQTKAPPAPAPVTVAPPVPAAVPRESPAAVYEAASAIVRKEPVETYDGVRLYSTEVAPQPIARTDAPPVDEKPVVAAKPLFELPEDTPVLAAVPEISPADAHETVHAKVSAAEILAPKPVAASSPAKAAPETKAAAASGTELPPPEPLKPEESYEWVNKIGLELLAPRPKSRIGWRIPVIVGLALALLLMVGLLYSGMLQHFFESSAVQQTSALASTSPTASAPEPPAPVQSARPSDNSVEMDVAREYQRRKDWTKAESSYRALLETNPNNRDAAIGLSDVLYQEQKYEESAAVLNKLRSAKSQ